MVWTRTRLCLDNSVRLRDGMRLKRLKSADYCEKDSLLPAVAKILAADP